MASTSTSTPAQNTGSQTAAPSLSRGSYVSVKPGTRWYYDSNGNPPSGPARGGKITYTSNNAFGYNIEGLGWIRKSDIVGYDTGGYTGDWANKSGRLAMLHEKELVLNANDTKNMLNTVSILRNLADSMGNTMLSKLAAVTASGSTISSSDQSLEQNVKIDASFPNVTSANEIESALNNLVNVASQRINRR